MPVTVNQIDEQTWSFEENGVRFFLLTGKEKALLIDSGMMTRNAKDLAQELTDLPVSLLNTHADRDHVGSNGQFESFYMHPSEASNYYNTQKQTGQLMPVWDGDILDLGDRPLEIIAIPGHTPGSLAILDVNHRRVFTGDPIQNGHIFMFGVQREMNSYRLSLLRLWDRKDSFDEIYPSHSTCPVKPDLIMTLYEGAGKVLAGEVEGTDEEVHGMPIRAYNVGAAVFLCGRTEEA